VSGRDTRRDVQHEERARSVDMLGGPELALGFLDLFVDP
jgi:hypothetical protein